MELENIIGNLIIAEYQVDRLRTRLSESNHRSSFGSDLGTNGKAYTHVIKHNNRWYKISFKIEELDIMQNKKEQEEDDVDGNTYSSYC
jgi:AAA15 family ATPase/GTPase